MGNRTRYAIVANPASGSMAMADRIARLKPAAAVLAAPVAGLETVSADALARCAVAQSQRCDVLVVAGGDGTFSLVANSVDLRRTTLAFLPFGTGNALTHTLGYRGNLAAVARQIRRGTTHRCDLIDCAGRRKAFMASLGIDGALIRRYESYRAQGWRGLRAHLRAGLAAYFRDYHPTGARLIGDGVAWRTERLLSLMVVKQPFFGMGLEAVPEARWDDGRLHIRTIRSGFAGALAALATGFTVGNRVGAHRTAETLTVLPDAPLTLQIDGERGWTGRRFDFRVLPGILRLRY